MTNHLKRRTLLLTAVFAIIILDLQCASDSENVEVIPTTNGLNATEQSKNEKLPKTSELTANLSSYSPESILSTADSKLIAISKQIDASSQLFSNQGIGPFDVNSLASFDKAMKHFEDKQWLAAIRELNFYLNKMQVQNSEKYLKAQFTLGQSYEAINLPARAIKAYLRYLAAFLGANSNKFSEMLFALRRTVALLDNTSSDKSRIDDLVSAIAVLDVPNTVLPDLYLISGKSALRTKSPYVATTLLQNLRRFGQDPQALQAKSKSSYLLGLIYASQGDWEHALMYLSTLTTPSTESNIRDLARIALARIESRLGHYSRSLRYYELIGEQSKLIKEATIESVYIHIKQKQDSEARAKATLAIARWPEDEQIINLRLMLSFLDMKAGHLNEAREGIKAADLRLNQLRNLITQKLVTNTEVKYAILKEIQLLSKGIILPNAIVEKSITSYSKLGELSRNVSEIRSDIRNIYYGIGRITYERLRPNWENRVHQLAIIGEDLLAVGQSLSMAEQEIFTSSLSPIEKQKLTSLQKRRSILLSSSAAQRRRIDSWRPTAHFLDLTNKSAELNQKLHEIKAKLKAGEWTNSQANSSKQALNSFKTKQLENRAQQLANELLNNLDEIKKRQVESLYMSSSHKETLRFVIQYTMVINEEKDILDRVRSTVKNPSGQILSLRSSQIWQQWQYLTEEFFAQMHSLEAAMKNDIGDLMADLEEKESRLSKLSQQLSESYSALNSTLKYIAPNLGEQLVNAIDGRYAYHRKWLADIDWLTFQHHATEFETVQKNADFEREILKDQYFNSDRGVPWQWPM